MKKHSSFPAPIFNRFFTTNLILVLALLLGTTACKKDAADIPEGETGTTDKPGIAIIGPGIFEVKKDPATLELFVIPDFSDMPDVYQVKGTPVGRITWEQDPLPGTAGFKEGQVITLAVQDEGGNSATREVILTTEFEFPATADGIRAIDFIEDHETLVSVNVHVLKYDASQEQASLILAVTPSQSGGLFDPMLLDPAQITLHLYDDDLQKINPLTYPDGIWEPTTNLVSWTTPCGAYLRFTHVKLNGQPASAALTGGTHEGQRFANDFDFTKITPQENVLPPTCEPKKPLIVEVPATEPCKCTWRSRFTTSDKWKHAKDYAYCWGGKQEAGLSLLMSGAKPFSVGYAIDECTGDADVAASLSNRESLEVWVECTPRPCPECCVPKGNCASSPSFTAYANLDPPGTALAGGRIKVTGSGGCSGLLADAAGAVRSSSEVDPSVKFTIGIGENSSIEILPLHKKTGVMEGTFADVDSKSGSDCEFTLNGIGLGEAKCLADADLWNWYARADIQLSLSVTDMLIKAWCTDGSSKNNNLGNAFKAEGK